MKHVKRLTVLTLLLALMAGFFPWAQVSWPTVSAASDFEISNGTLKKYTGSSTHIVIPDSVKYIGDYVFDGCTSLEILTIPDTVVDIGTRAFRGCSNLTVVNMGKSVKRIRLHAFRYCDHLQEVYYTGTEEQWNAITWDYDDWWRTTGNEELTGASRYYNATLLGITEQPKDISGYAGQELTLSMKAKGDGLTYQWYMKKAGASSWSKLSGKTTASIKVKPDASWDGAKFYCTVEDNRYDKLNTKAVTFTLTATPFKITTQPKAISGRAGAVQTLSVTAQGDNLTYQWYIKKASASSWSKLSGKTTASIQVTPDASWDGAKFYCHVEDKWGSKLNTASVYFTLVATPLKITTQPKAIYGKAGTAQTLSVTAQGDNLTYQWYIKKASASSWSKLSGKTTASIQVTPDASWHGAKFYCHIEDKWGNKLNTASVYFTMFGIKTQPKAISGKAGTAQTLSVTAQGDGLTYQWYIKKATASAWSKLSGKTTASIQVTPDASWDGAKFYCHIEDSKGNKVNTASVYFNLT